MTGTTTKSTKTTKPAQGELLVDDKRVVQNSMTVVVIGVYDQDKDGNSYEDGRVSILAKQDVRINFGTRELPDYQRVTVPHNGLNVLYFQAWDELAKQIKSLKSSTSQLIVNFEFDLSSKRSNIKSESVERNGQTYTNHVFADPAELFRNVKGFTVVHSKALEA